MSPYFATHAGMLKYVAREFSELSRSNMPNAKQLALYAAILDRMVSEITQPEGQNQPS